jgi:hypothetical protein
MQARHFEREIRERSVSSISRRQVVQTNDGSARRGTGTGTGTGDDAAAAAVGGEGGGEAARPVGGRIPRRGRRRRR